MRTRCRACGAIAASRSTGPTTRCQRFSQRPPGQLAHGWVVDTRPRREPARSASRARPASAHSRERRIGEHARRRPPRESAGEAVRPARSSRPSTRGPVSSTSRSRAGPKGRASVRSRWATSNAPGAASSSGRKSENDERSRRMPTRVWCRCGMARDSSRRAWLVRQWSMHSVATATNAVDAVGRRVERDRAGLARLGVGAEDDRQSSSTAGQDADGGGHIGSAVVVGTGASVVYFGPSARSTVTDLALVLDQGRALGQSRCAAAWPGPRPSGRSGSRRPSASCGWRGRWRPCR